MLKKLALASILIAIIPRQAAAMTREEVIALVTMPLAVSAAVDITGIPVPRLINVVTMMNEAEVPPPQFIEIVRYMPVTLVTDDDGDRFVQYVRVRHNQGLRGQAFVRAIDDDLPSYGVPAVDLNVYEPLPEVIYTDNEEEFFPVIVRTRVVDGWHHRHYYDRPFITFRPVPEFRAPIFVAVPRPEYYRPQAAQPWVHPVPGFVPSRIPVPVPGPRAFVPVPVPRPYVPVPVPGPRVFVPRPVGVPVPVPVSPPHPFVPRPIGVPVAAPVPVRHAIVPTPPGAPMPHPIEHHTIAPEPIAHGPAPQPHEHLQPPVQSTPHPVVQTPPVVHTAPVVHTPPPHQPAPVHTQGTNPATESGKKPKDKGKD